MRRKSGKASGQSRWQALDKALGSGAPQLTSVLRDEAEFISLLVKACEDGTSLAILKRYGSDGGPMVCFGSGYGVAGCLIAIDATIAAGKWRVDKPWRPESK